MRVFRQKGNYWQVHHHHVLPRLRFLLLAGESYTFLWYISLLKSTARVVILFLWTSNDYREVATQSLFTLSRQWTLQEDGFREEIHSRSSWFLGDRQVSAWGTFYCVCVCVCFHPDYPSLLIPLHHSLKPSGLLFDHTDITHVLRTEFVSFKCCVFTLKYPPFLFSWSSDDFESRHVQLFFLSCMKSSSLVSSSGLWPLELLHSLSPKHLCWTKTCLFHRFWIKAVQENEGL